MLACSKCNDYVDQEEVVPISPDEGVWCPNCVAKRPTSKELAKQILLNKHVYDKTTSITFEQLLQMSITLLELMRSDAGLRVKMDRLRAVMDSSIDEMYLRVENERT